MTHDEIDEILVDAIKCFLKIKFKKKTSVVETHEIDDFISNNLSILDGLVIEETMWMTIM